MNVLPESKCEDVAELLIEVMCSDTGLDPALQDLLQKHLDSCKICRDEYAALGSTLVFFSRRSLPEVPQDLCQRTLSVCKNRKATFKMISILCKVAACLLLVLGGLWLAKYDKSGRQEDSKPVGGNIKQMRMIYSRRSGRPGRLIPLKTSFNKTRVKRRRTKLIIKRPSKSLFNNKPAVSPSTDNIPYRKLGAKSLGKWCFVNNYCLRNERAKYAIT